MNECANFCDGFCSEEQVTKVKSDHTGSKSTRAFDPRSPPYNVNNRCSKQPLSTRTLPVEGTHYNGTLQYNAHSLYGKSTYYSHPQIVQEHILCTFSCACIFLGTGMSEAKATYNALTGIRPGKRPFVLTRSNYAGTGAYAAHWNGEVCCVVRFPTVDLPIAISFLQPPFCVGYRQSMCKTSIQRCGIQNRSKVIFFKKKSFLDSRSLFWLYRNLELKVKTIRG